MSADPLPPFNYYLLFAITRLEEHLCSSEEVEAVSPWLSQYAEVSTAEVGFVDLYIGLIEGFWCLDYLFVLYVVFLLQIESGFDDRDSV